jgi:hypothetical protein
MTYPAVVAAPVDYSRGMAALLTAIVVPIALSYLMRSAQRETLEQAGSRIVAYPRAFRVFAVLGWIMTVIVTFFACFLAKNADLKNGLAITGIFMAIMLPLHLEAFGAWITWDEERIYTRSGCAGNARFRFPRSNGATIHPRCRGIVFTPEASG